MKDVDTRKSNLFQSGDNSGRISSDADALGNKPSGKESVHGDLNSQAQKFNVINMDDDNLNVGMETHLGTCLASPNAHNGLIESLVENGCFGPLLSTRPNGANFSATTGDSRSVSPKENGNLFRKRRRVISPPRNQASQNFPISTYNFAAIPTMPVADGSTFALIDLNVLVISTPQEDSIIYYFSYSKQKELTVEIGKKKVGFKISSDDPILNEVMGESGEGLGL